MEDHESDSSSSDESKFFSSSSSDSDSTSSSSESDSTSSDDNDIDDEVLELDDVNDEFLELDDVNGIKNNRLVLIFLILACLASIYMKFHLINRRLNADQDTYLVHLDSSSFDKSSSLGTLQYDFYRDSCSVAENIVRKAMFDVHKKRNEVSANLLRLLFHDCFIRGCDASILLDDGNSTTKAEKQAFPSQTLKGFDIIDSIKERLEGACPGIVSCADTLVLAAREGIFLAGGPFYPVFTGRRDSLESHYGEALNEIPGPNGNISETLRLFRLRGFDDREIVSLLGGHSIGTINCEFFRKRLYNFSGTGKPDPSIASDFLTEIRLGCPKNTTSAVSLGSGFDPHYYQRLVRGRGLLFADQQLMTDAKTAALVQEYASDNGRKFQRDFSEAMVKLSNLSPLTGSEVQVRIKCSSVNSK